MGSPSRISRYRDWYASSGIPEAVSSMPPAVRASIVDARVVRGDQARPACSAVARRARSAVRSLGEFDSSPVHAVAAPGDPAGRDGDGEMSRAESARRKCEEAKRALGELHAQLDASFDLMGGVHNEHIGEALASTAMLEADLMSAGRMLAGAMGGR